MSAFHAFFEYLDQHPRLAIGALVVHTTLLSGLILFAVSGFAAAH